MPDVSARDPRLSGDTDRATFTRLVSHALRGATQSVVGALSLLADETSGEPLTPRQRLLVEAASAGAARLKLVSLDIQTLTEAAAGTLTPQRQSVPLTTLTREAIQQAQQPEQSDSQLFEIRRRLSPAVPPLVCDPGMTQRALVALIENALRFSPVGSPVTIESRKRRDRAIITVSDSGAGVEPEDAERIFDAFVTIRRPNITVGPGLGIGLGLAVARACVEAQGGSLSLAPAESSGATFVLELPLDPR
ncbi:MAG TPA: ATP-binding protein [Ktedonobacterales bacterium]